MGRQFLGAASVVSVPQIMKINDAAPSFYAVSAGAFPIDESVMMSDCNLITVSICQNMGKL